MKLAGQSRPATENLELSLKNTRRTSGTLKNAEDQQIAKRTHGGPPDREEDTWSSRVGQIDDKGNIVCDYYSFGDPSLICIWGFTC